MADTNTTDQLEEIVVTAKPITLVDNTNPLRQFRSYSYHFFLLACESTDVAAYLASSAATNAFQRTQKNAKLSPGQIDQPYPRNMITCPKGNYVIVIDTRTDTDIIIEDVQWGTTFIGDQDSSRSSIALNVVMTDGVINFIEPRGCNFLNILAGLGDQLNVDMICMPFLLRVQFYGHMEDGTVIELPATQGAQPFAFVPVDIQGTVDERGTAYKMDICGVINGIIHNPNFNALVDGQTFNVYPGKNLEYHLAQIQTKVNDLYQEQRTNVIKAFTSSQLDLSNAADVRYNFKLEPDSIVLQKLNDFGSNITDQAKVDSSQYIIKGTKEGGIAQVIGKLLMTSKTWVANAAEGTPADAASIDNTNKRFTFKVTQEYQSSSASVSRAVIQVNIVVSEYAYDTVVVIPTLNGQTQIKQPKISANQVLVFDYIYTGRNLDVLKMDINLSLGLALVQTLATAKTLSNQGQDTAGGQAPITYPVGTTSFTGPANIHGKVRPGTPIFAPYQWLETYLKQAEAVQNTATADGVWRSFANYQSVNTSITIHGNPLIMGKIMNPDRTVPNYVQINIKMPNTQDDIWEYQLGSNPTPGGYYKPFWYTGYYLIVSATNKFSGGQFTQDLELVSMPQVSISEGSVSATETTQDTQPNYRGRFFPNSPDAPPATGITPTAPVTPPNSSSSGGKLATPGQNPTSASHQDFVANYWNSALQSSQKSGINPDFTLAQAAVETNWGKNRFSQNFSSFFNVRSYNTTPNQYWGGTIIPGTGSRSGDAPFRAYDNPVNSWLDQSRWLTNYYPTAASATDISTYANGVQNGLGGRHWAFNDPNYIPNIINAYSQIQTYKSNLGIQPQQYYANAPIPSTTTPTTNYVAMNTTTSSGPSTSSSTSAIFATNRSVAQAAVAQKTAIFPTS